MARKAIQGYTEKSYFDNTRFLGLLASSDPLQEGYFRQLVNLNISDTNQSVCPRDGYLTTTLKNTDNSIISLSDQTIIYKDEKIQKHIIFDFSNSAPYSADISPYSIEDKYITGARPITRQDWTGVINFLMQVDDEIEDTYNSNIKSFLDTYPWRLKGNQYYFKEIDIDEYYNSPKNYDFTDKVVVDLNDSDAPDVLWGYISTIQDRPYTEYRSFSDAQASFRIKDSINYSRFFKIRPIPPYNFSNLYSNMYDEYINGSISIDDSQTFSIYDLNQINKRLVRATYSYTDDYNVSQKLDFWLQLYYRETSNTFYPSDCLIFEALDLDQHPTYDPTRRNIANDNSIIPLKMQNIYTETNRPDGHTSSVGQFLYFKDKDNNYAIQYVYPNKDYTISPYFDLSPASQVANNADAKWALRFDIFSTDTKADPLSEDVVVRSPWYDIEERKILLPEDTKDIENMYMLPTPEKDRHYKGLTYVIHVVPKDIKTAPVPSNLLSSYSGPFDLFRDAAEENSFRLNLVNPTFAFNLNYNDAKILQTSWSQKINTITNYFELLNVIKELQESALFYLTDLQNSSVDLNNNSYDRLKLPEVGINIHSTNQFLTGAQLIQTIRDKKIFTEDDRTGVNGVVFNLLPCAMIVNVDPNTVTNKPNVKVLASEKTLLAPTVYTNNNLTINTDYTIVLTYSNYGTSIFDIEIRSGETLVDSRTLRERVETTVLIPFKASSITSTITIDATAGVYIKKLSIIKTTFLDDWYTYPDKPFKITVASSIKTASIAINELYDFYDFYVTTGFTDVSPIITKYNFTEEYYNFEGDLFNIKTKDLKQQLPKSFLKSGYQITFYLYPYDTVEFATKENITEVKKYQQAWSTTPYITSGLALYGYDRLTVTYITESLEKEPEDIHNPDGALVFNGDRLVLWKDADLYISEHGNYYYFREASHKQFAEKIVKVIQYKEILMVFTVQHLYAVYEMDVETPTGKTNSDGSPGVSVETTWLSQCVLYNILTNKKYADAIQIFNQVVLFYSEDGQMFMIKPSTQIDDQTRFSLQYFNKSANDILKNYEVYMSERLYQYGVTKILTKDEINIKVDVSINYIDVYYSAPGFMTYILHYDILNNRYTVYDTLLFSDIKQIQYVPGGSYLLTHYNKKSFFTFAYNEPLINDSNTDMAFYYNFKKLPISTLLDTGDLNLNNHLMKRFRDLYITFKNLGARDMLFKIETETDGTIQVPFYVDQIEVKDINGTSFYTETKKEVGGNLLDFAGASYQLSDVLQSYNEMIRNNVSTEQGFAFDIADYTSNKMLTYRTSILNMGKVFRMKIQFISKGTYKIQQFGIIYKERRV